MNKLELSARVLECEPLRHLPPDCQRWKCCWLRVGVIEAGLPRRVELTITAVALGDLALLLKDTALGSELLVGVLAPSAKTR